MADNDTSSSSDSNPGSANEPEQQAPEYERGAHGERRLQSHLAEQTIIFISVVKWIALASATGAIVGLAAVAFLKILKVATTGVQDNLPYYYLGLPFAFFASAALIRYLAPDAIGHGTERVIHAVHRHGARVKLIVVPVKLVATVVTLIFGGSAGKEGPTAQIGAGLASTFSDMFHFSDEDRRKLLVCGISAGFGAVFGTPIAGALFGVEVLFVGSLAYEVLLASVVASITGFQVADAFGLTYYYHPFEVVPSLNEPFFLVVLLFGAIMGVVSFMLIEVLHQTERMTDRWKLRPEFLALIGGSLLAGLTLLLGTTDYLGLGLEQVDRALDGGQVIWYAFLVKIVFTVVTLSMGGSGGIITPLFFIGTAAGALFAQLTGQDSATFAAIGMVCMISGACNTPIAASILSVEMFGDQIGLYAPAACVVSFLMTGHRSVYPSQIIATRKADELVVEMGGEVEGTEYQDPKLRRTNKRTLFFLRMLLRLEKLLRDTLTWTRDRIKFFSEQVGEYTHLTDAHHDEPPSDDEESNTDGEESEGKT